MRRNLRRLGALTLAIETGRLVGYLLHRRNLTRDVRG